MSSIKEEILKTLEECGIHIGSHDAGIIVNLVKRHIEDAFDNGEKRGIHVAECWEFAKHPDSDENGPLSKSEYLKSKGITE